MTKSKILLLALCTSSLSAAPFSLGGLFDAISEKASSVSQVSANASEPDILVKDLNLTNSLSTKQYLRGIAQINYSVIPMGYNNNPKLGPYTNAQPKLEEIARHPDVSLKELASDAVQPLFNRVKENYAKVFSNPSAKNPYAFDLSPLDQFTRNSSGQMYSFDIKTHMKIPDRFVKKGKVVFETSKGPAFFLYRDISSYNKTGYNPYALVCLEKVNGKVMSDKKITTTVSKDNILEYGLTCYMGGYPDNMRNDSSRGRGSIKSISETQMQMPTSWTISSLPDPLEKKQGETYTLTNRDFFMYYNEVYNQQ